jgi:hypothetical protein
MGHVVLLGDSIFDNAAYTRGEPDVITHLRTVLPTGWQATLCAVDGAMTHNLAAQLRRVPADATHMAVSIGGNDALGQSDLLGLRAASVAEALREAGRRVDAFSAAYSEALAHAAATGLPLMVCTIYNGALPEEQAVIARVALMLFNDVIQRTALAHGAHVIELREVCSRPEDYANPIEPSGIGGLKIARAIATAISARR